MSRHNFNSQTSSKINSVRSRAHAIGKMKGGENVSPRCWCGQPMSPAITWCSFSIQPSAHTPRPKHLPACLMTPRIQYPVVLDAWVGCDDDDEDSPFQRHPSSQSLIKCTGTSEQYVCQQLRYLLFLNFSFIISRSMAFASHLANVCARFATVS